MTMHKEPSNKDEIPALCKESFISKNNGIAIIWVLAGLLISAAGTAVGWALTTNTSITVLQSNSKVIMEKQEKLDTDINRKLDILIKNKDQ